MNITINCSGCGQSIVIDESVAGVVQCPKCGQSLSVPSETAAKANPASATEPPPLPDSNQAPPIIKQTLIDQLRADYDHALLSFDTEVKELIQTGHEFQALELYRKNFTKIREVYDMLSAFYGMFRDNVETLSRFGSERLKQLGYDLTPTFKIVNDMTEEENKTFLLAQVRTNYNRLGITSHHWAVRGEVTMDIQFMLDTLQILVEPDYVPFSGAAKTDETEDKVDRRIPPTVKQAVWRRDMGKCVQCGSKEKLEYDHIIPVSKGGSNTERNIQLLCEKCNREKAAKIA